MTSDRDVETPAKTPQAAKPGRKAVTNVLLVDILLRTGLLLGRRQFEKTLLQRNFTRKQARRIVNGRPLTKSALSFVASRIASRSVPGAMLIGGGILAKLLIDARKSARKSDGQGEKVATDQADEA